MAPEQSSHPAPASTGLEGVSIGQTAIALVDGDAGRLIYRGHDAEVLAVEATFEETAYLLWHSRLPDDQELADLREARGRRPGDAARGALGAARASAPTRCPWTRCARASRPGPCCAAWRRAATATTRSGRSRPRRPIVADYARLRERQRAGGRRSRPQPGGELPPQAHGHGARSPRRRVPSTRTSRWRPSTASTPRRSRRASSSRRSATSAPASSAPSAPSRAACTAARRAT